MCLDKLLHQDAEERTQGLLTRLLDLRQDGDGEELWVKEVDGLHRGLVGDEAKASDCLGCNLSRLLLSIWTSLDHRSPDSRAACMTPPDQGEHPNAR